MTIRRSFIYALPWIAATLLIGSYRMISIAAAQNADQADAETEAAKEPLGDAQPYVVVLGIAQDAGYPQAGCRRECCRIASRDHARKRLVSCLAIVDPQSGQRWIIDATPYFREQLHLLDEIAPSTEPAPGLSGILLTHGHIGHYTGLMFVGHESIGASEIPVYAMPRMRDFLSTNGPWDQLVKYRNIVFRDLEADRPVRLNNRLTITPFGVPHREEYTEVVGFRIQGPSRSVAFIPDIDKWARWDDDGQRIEDVIAGVDVAFLDGTFYADGEIPDRDMSQIPHPFIVESMKRFADSLPAQQRAKVHFTHLNHTNPALDPDSEASRTIRAAGFNIAGELNRFGL